MSESSFSTNGRFGDTRNGSDLERRGRLETLRFRTGTATSSVLSNVPVENVEESESRPVRTYGPDRDDDIHKSYGVNFPSGDNRDEGADKTV
jgi:hypothetical protein